MPDLPRLRLSSIDSIEADPRLIEAIAGEPRLMPHLHLSLQAGDDLILKRMKRRHLRDDAIAFCAGGARRARPDMVFGADLIAGFPTETEAMFESTLRLGRGMRPDLAARLSLQRPRRHAGGADAAGRSPRRSASARRGCAPPVPQRVARASGRDAGAAR